MSLYRQGRFMLIFAAALLAWLASASGAQAQCQCYEDGCFDVGRCGYPDAYSFESWCRCNGGTPGWRDCTAADQINDGSGAECVAVPYCGGLPQSCGGSGGGSVEQPQVQEYVPPPHAEEMQRARELYHAGKAASQPPYIPAYVAPGASPAVSAAAPVDPAVGTTKYRKLAAKVPPLPEPSLMSDAPDLNQDEKARKVPPTTDGINKFLASLWKGLKTGVLKVGDYVLSKSPLGNYYQIVKINLWAKEKAFQDLDDFMDLAQRGFPEAEVNALLKRQDNRLLEFYWGQFGPPVDLPPRDGGKN